MLLSPPALPQEAPAHEGREVAFQGFNDFGLKGSVLPGGPHGYFTVLVAGTGPMDRDWKSPLLPPGRPGLDLALWLQKQGLGSLRYDKRYIGSRDPRLDISLDAQAGDVRSALDAARNLPEAKGRKLLLVAHSEGCLPALVASAGADAVLLLAPPGRPMADLLRSQIEAQLPPTLRGPNLGYLDSVLQAIRMGSPRPDAAPEVHPGLVRLAKGLMAPETLTFIRGTLDLDPMALASRLTVPTALAWGDRDIQSPKPASLPKDFNARVLTLPETNHLLRRETRPQQDLDPLKARSAYGSDTPLGTLEPLAIWLKSL